MGQPSNGSVNEATAAVAEPVVASGGSGVTSFDEIESLQQLPSREESSERGARKETSGKPEKKLHDAGKKPRKEAKNGEEEDHEEGDQEVQGEDQEEVTPDASPEGAKAAKEAKDKAAAAKAKTFKVRSGDKDVEIRSDAAFEVTVAGKSEKVPLQDLLNNYSGKVVYEKKFGELDKERKSFHAERDELQTSVDQLFELAVKQNKPREAIQFLAESMGGDPVQVWKNLRDAVIKSYETYSTLSPEERKLKEAEDELTWHREKNESAKAAADRARTESALGNRVKAVQETHKISEQEFHRIYEELKTSGQLKPGELTPELVGDYYAETQSRQELGKLIEDVNPDLEDKPAVLREMRAVMVKNGFNIADMRDVIAEVYGSKKAKGLAKKLKGSQPANTARANKTSENPVSFDEV